MFEPETDAEGEEKQLKTEYRIVFAIISKAKRLMERFPHSETVC